MKRFLLVTNDDLWHDFIMTIPRDKTINQGIIEILQKEVKQK